MKSFNGTSHALLLTCTFGSFTFCVPHACGEKVEGLPRVCSVETHSLCVVLRLHHRILSCRPFLVVACITPIRSPAALGVDSENYLPSDQQFVSKVQQVCVCEYEAQVVPVKS